MDSILAAAAVGPECSQEPGPAVHCCPPTETSGSALLPIPVGQSICRNFQLQKHIRHRYEIRRYLSICFFKVFSWSFCLLPYEEVVGDIYQLVSSPADRSSSKRILHTHPNWLFLWRRCPLQICHLGQKCVKALSLLAQHRLKKITLNSTSNPPGSNVFSHTCDANGLEMNRRHNSPIFHFQKPGIVQTLNMDLTQHEYGFENSKYCSNHYAVLRGSKKMTITRRPDTNWTQN